MPRVSVIMPVYNGARFIKDSILSILNQTYTDWELIIVNDGSTDKTADIIDKYARSEPRIRVFHLDKNQGVSAASNFAVEQSTGEYITRLDSDDIAFPERLQVQVDFMDNHPDIDLAGSYFKAFHPGGTEFDVVIPTDSATLAKLLPTQNQLGHSTVMMRRAIFDKVGGYDTTFTLAEDYEFYLRVLEHGKIANIPQFLVFYRMHPDQAGARQDAEMKASAKRARSLIKDRKKNRRKK